MWVPGHAAGGYPQARRRIAKPILLSATGWPVSQEVPPREQQTARHPPRTTRRDQKWWPLIKAANIQGQ
jgi:hypothetical protein